MESCGGLDGSEEITNLSPSADSGVRWVGNRTEDPDGTSRITAPPGMSGNKGREWPSSKCNHPLGPPTRTSTQGTVRTVTVGGGHDLELMRLGKIRPRRASGIDDVFGQKVATPFRSCFLAH
jgi:hypothetical protein